MVTITLYAKQKKRHRCTEQTFELCGRRWGWDVLREQDQNMYIISSKQTTSPGGMHETSAQGWCTGKTQRDGVGRDVGKGSGWGIYVNPWLIHVNVWQKTIQYCKVISLQPIKINGGKKGYWRELPCPLPGDLPNSGIEPRSLALQVDSLLSEPPRKPKNTGVGSLSLLQGICPT